MNTTEKCKKIWSAYKIYAGAAFVSRRGYELTGMAAKMDFAKKSDHFNWRGESGLEHQAKATWLATVFLANFPKYFGEGVSGQALMTVLLCHDVGETVVGDIPDDGNALHGTKDAKELEVFEEMAAVYDFEKDMIVNLFKQFQTNQVRIGQAIYAIDKLEAVLTQIFLEKYGLVGYIDKKPDATDLDRHFMEVTGVNLASDCWAAHLKHQIYEFPDLIKDPVYTLIRVAVEDVRSENFGWWDSYIPQKNEF